MDDPRPTHCAICKVESSPPRRLHPHLKKWHNIHSIVPDKTPEVIIHTAIVDCVPCSNPFTNSVSIPKLLGLVPTVVHSCYLFLESRPQLRTWGHGEFSLSRVALGQILTATGKEPPPLHQCSGVVYAQEAKPQLHETMFLLGSFPPPFRYFLEHFLEAGAPDSLSWLCFKRSQPWTLPTLSLSQSYPFHLLRSFQIYALPSTLPLR